MGFPSRIGLVLLSPREAFRPENLDYRGVGEPFGLLVAFSAVSGLLVSSLLMAVVRVLVGIAGWFGFETGSFLASASIIIPAAITISFIISAIILWILISAFTHLSARYV